jgi:hypothetical protein
MVAAGLSVASLPRDSQVSVTCEELAAAREEVTMVVSGSGLRNLDVLSKSDPFLEISRSMQVGVHGQRSLSRSVTLVLPFSFIPHSA